MKYKIFLNYLFFNWYLNSFMCRKRNLNWCKENSCFSKKIYNCILQI